MKVRLVRASKFNPFTIPGILFAAEGETGGGTTEGATDETSVGDTADDDTEGSDALGDKGKKALDTMKGQRNAARDELRAFKALGLSPEQITALTKKPEGEAPDADAIKATAIREANAKANERVLRSEIKALAATRLAKPELAAKLLDLSKFEVDDDGNVDEDDIADAIDALAKMYDLAPAQGKRFQGNADGGTRKESRPSQLAQSDLDGMSAEAIVQARKDGRLNDLMGITAKA